MSTTLNDLRPYGRGSAIELMVYRKWTNSIPPDPTPTGYCCMLIDKEGSAIQANMDFSDKEYFDRLIEVGGCYKINDYICEQARQWMMTVERVVSLKFGRFTKFEIIPSDGNFLTHYFDFVSYNQLLQRLNKHRILTDYMACLRSVGEIQKSGNPNKNTNVWRILELENLMGDTMQVSIWNQLAEDFDVEAYESLPRPVLIVVSSCRVTSHKGNLQLTATPSTHYYLNPNIEEVERSFQEYLARYEISPPLLIQKCPFKDLELEKVRNRYPLKTLLDQDPKRYKTDRFTTEATIIDVIRTCDWYYIACPDCSKKLAKIDGLYECHDHGPITETPNHVYSFKTYINDETAQAAVTFFGRLGNVLTDIDCNKMVLELGNTHSRIIPDPILEIIGKKKIFQIHFNPKSSVGNVDFVADKVFDIPIGDPVENESQLIVPHNQTTASTNVLKDKNTSEVNLSTPSESEKQPMEPTTPLTYSLNKRKPETSVNIGKKVKRGLFQEQGINGNEALKGSCGNITDTRVNKKEPKANMNN